MSKGNVSNEALHVFREGKTLLRESRGLKTKLEQTLLDLFNTKSRQEALRFSPVNVGRLKELHGITTFDNDLLNDVRTFVEKATSDVICRFSEKVCKESGSCRKASYHKAKVVVSEIEKTKLTIYNILHSYNTILQNVVAGRRGEVGDASKGDITGPANDWLYLLGCIDEFNQLMKEDEALLVNFSVCGTDGRHNFLGSRASSSQNTIETGSEEGGSSTPIFILQCVRYRWTMIHQNHHPSYIQKLGRQTSSSQILRCLAIERCWMASFELAKTIVLGYDRKTLENAAEEASWLTVPQSITPSFTSLSGLLPGLSKMTCSYRKNKDGNGNKRKNRNSGTGGNPSKEGSPGGSSGMAGDRPNELGPDISIPAEQVIQRGLGTSSLGSHIELVEEFVSSEEAFLSDFFSVLAKVPGLLAKSAFKSIKNKSGSAASCKISTSVRQKMAEYYHDVLWQGVGEMAEMCLLWQNDLQQQQVSGAISNEYLPYAFQHPRVCLGLCSLVQDNLYAQLGDTYPPLVFPTMHMLVEAVNLHVISSSWDLQFLSCLSESTRSKSAVLNINANMKEGGMRNIMCNGTKATKTGKLFYDTIKSMSRLNNRCHPDMIRDFIEHGGHDPEEFPFMEEVQALRRLEMTLFSMRNWQASRANATLHNWHVKEFLLITQCDLLNAVDDCFGLLQLSDHDETVNNTKSISIRLFVHLQTNLAKQVRECQDAIKKLPDLHLNDMSLICRTFSLATLRNIFPDASSWRASHPTHSNQARGADSNQTASPYVQIYIDRVLSPVLEALVPMKTDIQQNVGRIVLKTFCDAWLEHIRNKKIKFSDNGAHQISQDFAALRTWIGENQHIKEESRRYLLLLDAIRRCEGVARLLQSKPGETVDVKPAKNRVVPINVPDAPEPGAPPANPPPNAERSDSPVAQILEAIPAELYVANQQQWIGLRKNSKILPFCCR